MSILPVSAAERARAVAAMFDGIAGRYDLLNRLMSMGLDGRWRREAVRALGSMPGGPLLDVGVGTGDLATAMQRRCPGRTVVGVDLSRGMMDVARSKARRWDDGVLALACGDALALPFADATFAGAATAFTLRNVADVPLALREVRRVLRAGAPFACLEITHPGRGPRGGLFTLYFSRLLPRVTGLLARDPDAYRYLPRSVERFMTSSHLARTMRAAGFVGVRVHRFWPGPVTLHVGHNAVARGCAGPALSASDTATPCGSV